MQIIALASDATENDTAAPKAVSAVVDRCKSLVIGFDEALGAAPDLANSAFAVSRTTSGGAEAPVALSGSPSVSGNCGGR